MSLCMCLSQCFYVGEGLAYRRINIIHGAKKKKHINIIVSNNHEAEYSVLVALAIYILLLPLHNKVLQYRASFSLTKCTHELFMLGRVMSNSGYFHYQTKDEATL
jgi:hypothetical protein